MAGTTPKTSIPSCGLNCTNHKLQVSLDFCWKQPIHDANRKMNLKINFLEHIVKPCLSWHAMSCHFMSCAPLTFVGSKGVLWLSLVDKDVYCSPVPLYFLLNDSRLCRHFPATEWCFPYMFCAVILVFVSPWPCLVGLPLPKCSVNSAWETALHFNQIGTFQFWRLLSYFQSLLMVFIQLIRYQLAMTLEFLSLVPGPTGKAALDYILTEWCSKQGEFYGSYERKARYCFIFYWGRASVRNCEGLGRSEM